MSSLAEIVVVNFKKLSNIKKIVKDWSCMWIQIAVSWSYSKIYSSSELSSIVGLIIISRMLLFPKEISPSIEKERNPIEENDRLYI